MDWRKANLLDLRDLIVNPNAPLPYRIFQNAQAIGTRMIGLVDGIINPTDRWPESQTDSEIEARIRFIDES